MVNKKIDDSKSFCFYSIDIPNQSALKDMIISNADLEKLSYYKDEKEILFFPFSCFEIEKIEINSLTDLFLENDDLKQMFEENNPQISYENLKYYVIKLNYLGKYKEEIENLKDKIPETEFAKNLLSTEIVDKNERLQENGKGYPRRAEGRRQAEPSGSQRAEKAGPRRGGERQAGRRRCCRSARCGEGDPPRPPSGRGRP